MPGRRAPGQVDKKVRLRPIVQRHGHCVAAHHQRRDVRVRCRGAPPPRWPGQRASVAPGGLAVSRTCRGATAYGHRSTGLPTCTLHPGKSRPAARPSPRSCPWPGSTRRRFRRRHSRSRRLDWRRMHCSRPVPRTLPHGMHASGRRKLRGELSRPVGRGPRSFQPLRLTQQGQHGHERPAAVTATGHGWLKVTRAAGEPRAPPRVNSATFPAAMTKLTNVVAHAPNVPATVASLRCTCSVFRPLASFSTSAMSCVRGLHERVGLIRRA